MIKAAILPFKELGRIIHADLNWGVRGGLKEEYKVTGALGTFSLDKAFLKILQYSSTQSIVPVYCSSSKTRMRITLEIRVPFELNIEMIC